MLRLPGNTRIGSSFLKRDREAGCWPSSALIQLDVITSRFAAPAIAGRVRRAVLCSVVPSGLESQFQESWPPTSPGGLPSTTVAGNIRESSLRGHLLSHEPRRAPKVKQPAAGPFAFTMITVPADELAAHGRVVPQSRRHRPSFGFHPARIGCPLLPPDCRGAALPAASGTPLSVAPMRQPEPEARSRVGRCGGSRREPCFTPEEVVSAACRAISVIHR